MKLSKQLFYLGCLTISLLVTSDVISKLCRGLDLDFYRYTLIAKSALLTIYTIFFLVNIKAYLAKEHTKKIIIIIFSLITVFIVSNIFPFNKTPFDYDNTEYLIRCLFYPVTYLIFFQLYSNKGYTTTLFKYYEWIFLINLGLIVIAFVFGIDLLKSYTNPNRFGYSGIYMRTNQVSYIFLIFIAIYYYQVNYLKKNQGLKLFFTLIIALLIGTKRLYFFLILLLIFHLYKSRNLIKKVHVFIASIILLLGYLFRHKLALFFHLKFKIFVDLYHEKGLLAAITSYRNETLLDTLNYEVYPNWTVINFLFGGTNFTTYRPELDLIDIFLFFGAVGVVVYVIFVKMILKDLNINNQFLTFFFVVILGISFTSSGFFNSVNIPFIVLLGAFFIKHQSNSKLKD